MDPLTLFALANAAVSAVKAGCKLYKDIKGAAGDVKDVLKDLDAQWAKRHPADKPATVEQRNQFVKTKNEVITNNKKANAGEHTEIYTQIGNHLGTYYDNYNKCKIVFEEEEKKSKSQVYVGDDSLGKRALQRVLMRKQLQQMGDELRQIMIYECPKELGALWTEVNDMMEIMGTQQRSLIVKQINQQEVFEKRRIKKKEQQLIQFYIGVSIMITIFVIGGLFMWVAYDRQQKYPQYGNKVFPETEEEAREKLKPKQWIGR